MRRYLGALFMGVGLFLVGKERAGWGAGVLAALVGVMTALFMGTLVRGRAMRKAPEAPAMLPGETPLLHGPVSFIEAAGSSREGWAYLSDQRLSLFPSDGGQGQVLKLNTITELRPPKRLLFGQGPLGLVANGQLWRLKVPDLDRWLAALRLALHGKD
jgi:hypothetical protein